MTRQILFSEENSLNTWQARVWNILGNVVGKRLEKIIIPIVCDKERAGEYCINTRAGEDFINAKKKQFTVRQNKFSKSNTVKREKQSYKTNKLEGEKIHTGIYVYTKVYSRKHTRLSDSQTKQTNGGTNGQTCGWADRGKDR